MSREEPIATNPAVFAAILQQNWENVRHIKSERMWYLNTAVTSAGVLSVLQSVRGGFVLQSSLLLCMCFLSAIGLLTSLRLKAELEECLEKNSGHGRAGAAGPVHGARAAPRPSVTVPRLPVDFPSPLLLIDGAVLRPLSVSTRARATLVRSRRHALHGTTG